jgi:Transposase IS116/IS110/IS902 family
MELPVYEWLKTIRGAGALGLATIVAEAGSLDRYANPAKLWNRLGFAPFDGHAGSTWKRESWRPRKLSKEEWIENPFSGERYALIHQIAVWLVNAQWISAKKAGAEEGRPNGIYGAIYAERRAHTAITHGDWSKQHSRMDGLRVAMKAFLLDLWCIWNNRRAKYLRSDQHFVETQPANVGSAAAGQRSVDAHDASARRSNPERGSRPTSA